MTSHIWKPIETNYLQEVYIPLVIIMIVLLLIVALVCWVSFIRFKELTKLGSQGIDRLDKYQRWLRKQDNVPHSDNKNDADTEALEKLVRK